MSKFFFFFLFFSVKIAYCQLQIDWQQSYGGTDDEVACNMIKLDDGYIIIGSTLSTDGPVSFNHGGYDIWAIRIGNTGNILWEKTLGGSGTDFAWSAFQASDTSGIFILGLSSSSDGDIINDPYPGISNNWMVKISEGGNILWSKKFGTPNGMIYQKSATPTSDGGYILGAMTSEAGGCVNVHYGSLDAWISKFDETGEIEWDLTVGSSEIEAINHIIPTPDGGYIAAMNGYSNDSTGNVGCNSLNYSSDAIVCKINSQGEIEWQHCYGGSQKDLLFSIAPVADGYLIAGLTFSFDGDLENAGNHGGSDFADCWIFKIDLIGNIIWSKCYGGSEGEGAFSIHQSPDGNFLAFCETTSKDGDVLENNTYNQWESSIWIFKINPSGQLLWQQSIGGIASEHLKGVSQFEANRYAISAMMQYSPSCDVNCSNFIPETEFNYWQFVVTDLTDSTTLNSVNIPEYEDLNVFPNPTTNNLTFRRSGNQSETGCLIQILDVNGKIVFNQQFPSSYDNIDVSFLPGGFYILRYVANKEIIQKKISIN